MNQIRLTIAKRIEAYELPAGWEEVPSHAWESLMPWLLSPDNGYNRTMILCQLLVSKRKGKRIDPRRLKSLDPVQVQRVADLLDWVYQDPVIAPPFEKIALEGVDYLLPNEMLSHISLIEYAYVDFCFNQYLEAAKSKEPEGAQEWLTKIVCYLCRPEAETLDRMNPATFKGDPREQFNTAVCDQRLPQFDSLPNTVKLAVLMFFAGCKKKIHELYQHIWPKPTETGGLPIGAKSAKPQEWIDLCFHLAGGKFGTLSQTMYTDLSLVLHELSLQTEKAA